MQKNVDLITLQSRFRSILLVFIFVHSTCIHTPGGSQICNALRICFTYELLGDNVYQPFEPELDWNSFGIRVEEKNIPILHTILASMDNETYKQKQVIRIAS